MIYSDSPFKFLDSYQEEDIEVFFGREKETEDMYDALSGVKHLLVYGPSGVGKTSLVECGLRNQFSDADWYALTIRRGNNIIASAYNEINRVLVDKFKIDPVTNRPTEQDFSLGTAVEYLFTERYQPIYLIFDQFEELLIANDDTEKEEFFEQLNQLIMYKIPCRVLLILREEFIGHLSNFENLCPTIFQHRFRLEKMRRRDVASVISNMLEAPRYQEFFKVRNSRQLVDNILRELPDQRQEIELAHVQVFLTELWERASKENKDGGPPLLYPEIIRKSDSLTSVLDSFLKKQLKELEPDYGKGVCLEALAKMISEKRTKLQLSEEQLSRELESVGVRVKKSLTMMLTDLSGRGIIRPLKSGTETQYEISHDILAVVVGENLTDEMKMREQASEAYRFYEPDLELFKKEWERTNDPDLLLSQKDLDRLRFYKEYKDFPEDLNQLVNESLAELERQKQEELRKKHEELLEKQEELKKSRFRFRVMLGLFLLAVLAIVVAGKFWRQAERTKREALEATITANQNLLKAHRADVERQARETEIARSHIASFQRYGAEEDVIMIDSNKVMSLKYQTSNLNQQIDSLTHVIDSLNKILNPESNRPTR